MSDSTAQPTASTDNPWQPLVLFVIKVVVVVAAVTISLLILIDEVVSDLDEMIDQRIAQLHAEFAGVGKFTGRRFWTHIEEMLDQAAEPKNAIPADRQQRLLEDIRVLAARARPFVLEAQSTLSASPPAAGAAKEK